MWVPRFERIEESMAGWDDRAFVAFVRASHKAESKRKECGFVKLKCMSGFPIPIFSSPTCTTKDRDSSAYIKPNMQIIFPASPAHITISRDQAAPPDTREYIVGS